MAVSRPRMDELLKHCRHPEGTALRVDKTELKELILEVIEHRKFLVRSLQAKTKYKTKAYFRKVRKGK